MREHQQSGPRSVDAPDPDRVKVPLRVSSAPRAPHEMLTSANVLNLQRTYGNHAVRALLQRATGNVIQRSKDDDERPRDRSRRSRPRNCPPGTKPIDESGLDRETVHGIKDGIGAGPQDWVGITPDGRIVTGDSEGNATDEGHVSDHARRGAEEIPKWVWALLSLAAMIALIVLFATGVGEIAVILAGLGWAAAAVVMAVVRAHGLDSGESQEPVASGGAEGSASESPVPDTATV